MGRVAPIKSCRLCLKAAKLCFSHIIPEFFYASLYDHEHKIRVLSADPSENRPKLQKGLREYLLCPTCEAQFCAYERYVSGVFYRNQIRATRSSTELLVHGIDYSTFKLFMMSLLWRMGTSTLEMFSGVSLGIHEERLRLALLAEDSMKPTDYGFLIHALFLDNTFLHDFTVQAAPIEGLTQPIFRVVIAGFLFILFTAPVGFLIQMQERLLRPSGDLLISRGNTKDIPILDNFMRKVAAADKARRAHLPP